jgi:hypothetical protein
VKRGGWNSKKSEERFENIIREKLISYFYIFAVELRKGREKGARKMNGFFRKIYVLHAIFVVKLIIREFI